MPGVRSAAARRGPGRRPSWRGTAALPAWVSRARRCTRPARDPGPRAVAWLRRPGRGRHDRVVEPLGTGVVVAHVVRRPPGAEVIAAGGQFADEVRQASVARVAAGLGAQVRHDVVRGLVPVAEEVAGAGAEEGEPGDVGRSNRVDVHLRVQRVAEPVGGQDVPTAIAHVRGGVGDGVEDALHAGAHLLRRRSALRARLRAGVRRAGEVEQVRPLGLVQLQRPRDRLQDAFRGAGEVPALEVGVVVDAHPGEQRRLFPAEPGDAAVAAVGRQARLVRREPGPPGSQELANLAPVVHGFQGTTAPTALAGSGITWNARHAHTRLACGFVDGAGRMPRPHRAERADHASMEPAR